MLSRINCRSSNFLEVTVGPLTVWFSHGTMIAFQFEGRDRVVMDNYWSKRIGKHLKEVDGGNERKRVDPETFDRLFEEQAPEAFRSVPGKTVRP